MSLADYLECPITRTQMVDPVTTVDGHTYERAAILDWFSRGHRSSPATGATLSSLHLTPNFAVLRLLGVSQAAAVAAAAAATSPAIAASVVMTAPAIMTAEAKPFQSVRPHIGGRTFTGKNGKTYLQIQAHVPHDTPLSTTGSDYIISIDTSGSMETIAWVKLADGGQMGISRLDLVKHLVKTILGMLGPQDRMALVSFSSEARPVLGLTHVTDAGKALLLRELDRLRADGSTHLYGGVEEAARIASSDTCRGRRIVGMILTDGQPTESIHPVTGGRSTLSVLQERVRVTNPWTFHAIGFSSDINSRLLEQLAAFWKGRMLFVPSGDMVSTNGINLTAFEKTVVSLGTTVEFTYATGIRDQWTVGPLGVGQRRNLIREIPGQSRDPVRIELASALELASAHELADLGSVELADCRNDVVETLTSIVDYVVMNADTMSDIRVVLVPRLMALYERHAGSRDPGVQSILRDIKSPTEGEGQCRIALDHLGPSDWGLHYLRAYRDHMRDGVCMNFKDPGLKLFETSPFLEFQRQGDEAFASIPPPPIHRHGAAAAAVAMTTAFHNSSGGCFEGSMPVRMANGSAKPIRDVRRGDLVWTPTGAATVEYALELNTLAPSQPMVQLSPHIAVTPWHPCRHRNETQWSVPFNYAQYTARPLQTVYNLVLDRGHVIESPGTWDTTYQFVTLGHGFQESPLQHAFFGSKERIVASLAKQPGFEEGRPVYRNLVAVKEEGLIVEWSDA